jgi:hypothetical protein
MDRMCTLAKGNPRDIRYNIFYPHFSFNEFCFSLLLSSFLPPCSLNLICFHTPFLSFFLLVVSYLY